MSALLAFAGGLGAGFLFFAGLKLTVEKGIAASTPWLWFALSALVRTALALAIIYFSAGGRFEGYLACMAGFYSARFLICRRINRVCPGTTYYGG